MLLILCVFWSSFGTGTASAAVRYQVTDLGTLAPISDPSTLALLGIGFIGLLAYAWRRKSLRRTALVALTFVLLPSGLAKADVFNMGPGLTSLETVPVGNPGNAADQDLLGQGRQFGAVNYVYRMGKYEVTNAQYCEFLNAKAVTDTYGLYNGFMSIDACGGINRSGSSGSYTYAVKSGYENMPVTHVCWYDTVRFANWLQNGQGSGSTESGTYTITGGGFNSGTVAVPDAATRATWTTDPHWVLPSEDEWYKAAYHQPAAQGGDTDNYWGYPTATNSAPYSDQPPGSDAPAQANTANFKKDDSVANGYDDGYAVTGSTGRVSTQNYLTNVGAYTLSDSFYGTFDQAGNVWEWNEALIASSSRGNRGGGWSTSTGVTYYLAAWGRSYDDPAFEGDAIGFLGFRVASVPEPGSLAMFLAAAIGLLIFRLRRSR